MIEKDGELRNAEACLETRFQNELDRVTAPAPLERQARNDKALGDAHRVADWSVETSRAR